MGGGGGGGWGGEGRVQEFYFVIFLGQWTYLNGERLKNKPLWQPIKIESVHIAYSCKRVEQTFTTPKIDKIFLVFSFEQPI